MGGKWLSERPHEVKRSLNIFIDNEDPEWHRCIQICQVMEMSW